METQDDKSQLQEQGLSHLSRSERRKLRKQQRREQIGGERAKRRGKRIFKRIIILTVIILVVVSYMTFRNYRLKAAPEIQITPTTHNFGTVSVAEGAVSTLLTLENQGKSDLIIKKIKSDCGCTSASLIVDGEESPTFGMHDSSTGWSATLKPGQKAQLKVNYNPRVHKELRGGVVRNVMVFSNDPRNKVKQVRIDAYQVD